MKKLAVMFPSLLFEERNITDSSVVCLKIRAFYKTSLGSGIA